MAPELTNATTINGWAGALKPRFPMFKTIVLQVVGKHAIVTPKVQQVMRVYLRGGAVVYRLVIWEGKLLVEGTNELANLFFKFKLGSVVRLKGVQLTKFYAEEDAAYPEDLNQAIEFTYSTKSSVEILEHGGGAAEYPPVNIYPPFWKKIKDVGRGDKDLAMRVLVLDTPVKVQDAKVGKVGSAGVDVMMTIGDGGGSKAVMLVKFVEASEFDSAMLAELKPDVEIVFWGGYMFDNNGNIGIRVDRFEYIMVGTPTKLAKLPAYQFVKLPEKVAGVPTKKIRLGSL